MNLKGEVVKKYCAHRTISLSWFIGKAICTARALRTDIVDALVRINRHLLPSLTDTFSDLNRARD